MGRSTLRPGNAVIIGGENPVTGSTEALSCHFGSVRGAGDVSKCFIGRTGQLPGAAGVERKIDSGSIHNRRQIVAVRGRRNPAPVLWRDVVGDPRYASVGGGIDRAGEWNRRQFR